MTPFPLEGRKIAILSTLGFEFTELTGPKYILEGAGAEVKVIAPDLSHYTGFTLREGLASDIRALTKAMAVPPKSGAAR
jgi:putative intracellular protease/amidase